MSAPFEQSQADDTCADADERARAKPSRAGATEGGAAASSSATARRMVPARPSPTELADRNYLAALKRVGLLDALDEEELDRIVSRLPLRADESGGAPPSHITDFARHIDLLELYFGAANDLTAALERVRSDRFVIHHASSGENAHAVLRRVASVAPEIGQLRLERIVTDDGPLVLRLGEYVCAVDEDDDETEGSNGLDPSALDVAVVAVQSLLRAANVLLKHEGVKRRFVLLRRDSRREAFCALDLEGAMELCAQELIEERSASRLLEFGAF